MPSKKIERKRPQKTHLEVKKPKKVQKGLLIQQTMYQKIQYLLTRFPTREWSGPAWYKCLLNKHGFPIYWELLYFKAIDLGHGAATEYEGEELSKTIFEIYSKNKKVLAGTYLGMIHSHHNMGAYHSSTDEETLIDMCPEEGFYGSLVVSSKVSDAMAFAFSYKDQFNNMHIHPMSDGDIKYQTSNVPKEFVAEANAIKEKADKTSTYTYNGSYTTKYNYNQNNLFDTHYLDKKYQNHISPNHGVTKVQYEEMEDLMEQVEDGAISYTLARNVFRRKWDMDIQEFHDLSPTPNSIPKKIRL